MRTIGSQKQLFIDDDILASLDHVQRVMHAPHKYEHNPVLTIQEPWESLMPYVYGTVMSDPDSGLFKMWYSVWTGQNDIYFRLCYATSRDGKHWERPNLGAIGFEGAKDNNILEDGLAMPSVFYTPQDPDPSRRFKMLAGVSVRGDTAPWLALFSGDGIHWQRHPQPAFATNKPFLPGDEATAMWDPYSQRYVAIVKVDAGVGTRRYGRDKRRSVALAFSDDFIRWTLPELVFTPDEQDDENTARRSERFRDRISVRHPAHYSAEWYNLTVHPYEGLYLGCLSVLDASGPGPYGNQDGTMHIQLVSSRDLRHWNRIGNRQPFIELGEAGRWDSEMVNGTSTQFVYVGDEIWIYYSGFPFTHQDETVWAPERDKGYPRFQPGGIGLATLRRDGFVSVDGGEDEGSLSTHAFHWQGKQLYVNGMTTGGEITCELLDGVGDPLPGFGRDNCVPFTGDSIRQPVSWQGADGLPSPALGPVRLRIHLRRAKVFSFWIE